MERYIGLLGVGLLIAVAWGMSSSRRRVPWRLVMGGVALQFAVAALVLRFGPVVTAFDLFSGWVNAVIGAADAGIAFVFGRLGDPSGPLGFVFIARVLPIIIFFSALMAVLYHVGLMPRLIAALAWALRRTLGITGTEALVVAANVFVGQTEAPLCVRPYLDRLSRSQLCVLMVGGFATIAGSVLAAIVGIIGPEFTRHLIAASVMSAPAAVVISKILEPETAAPVDGGLTAHWGGERAANALDAAAIGTADGLKLALNVGAMLIAFVSLLALGNLALGGLGGLIGLEGLTIQRLLGWALAPLAFALGAPWAEAHLAGSLLGAKLVLTELVAYGDLARIQAGDTPLSPRTARIAAYALCGFANLPSVGIQIGGLAALAPSRRSDIVRLALRAMVGGALASWMTAAIAGLFIAN